MAGWLVLSLGTGLYMYLFIVVRSVQNETKRKIQALLVCAAIACLPSLLPRYKLASINASVFLLNLSLNSQHILLRGGRPSGFRSAVSSLRHNNRPNFGKHTIGSGPRSGSGGGGTNANLGINSNSSEIDYAFSTHGSLRHTHSTPHLAAVRVNSNNLQHHQQAMIGVGGNNLQSMRMTSVHVEMEEDEEKEKQFNVSAVVFIQQTLLMLIPYVYNRPNVRRRRKPLVRDSLSSVMKAMVYLYIVNVSWLWLMQCLGGGVHQMISSYLHQVVYTTVYCIHWASVALFHYSAQKGLLPLLTNDRINVKVIFVDPLWASSPSDFWGNRWSLITQNTLATAVYEPVTRRTKSPILGVMASFLLSGVMHAYIVELVFGRRAIHAFTFFILHGIAVSIEKWWLSKGMRKPSRLLGMLLWNVFAMVTLPLYFGILARAAPQLLQAYIPDICLYSVLKVPAFECF